MKRLQNIVGERHGRLTVIAENIGRKNHKQLVLARCACGTVVEKTITELRSGSIESCGCYRKEWQAQNAKRLRKSPGEAAFNGLLNAYVQGAKRRHLEFTLSKSLFKWLTQQPCAYCGAPPDRIFKTLRESSQFQYNGIDRKDSRMGYHSSNCVPSCHTCNIAKGTMSFKQFVDWIKTVHDHLFIPKTPRHKPYPNWLLPEVHA